jgi:cytoskeletal protein CcmA (bactofilin family)
MAIFGKDRERSDRGSVLPPTFGGSGTSSAGGAGAERERSVPTMPSEASGSGNNAFLGKGSRVVGKLTFEGPVRIEGHVEGEITAQDALTIGESAVVNAQIVGSTVVVQGRVTGDVTARKRLEIRAPGKLYGNITAPSLVIQEGVVFEGQCNMGAADAQRTEQRAEQRAEKDRQGTQKVTPFPSEGSPLKVHSEGAK